MLLLALTVRYFPSLGFLDATAPVNSDNDQAWLILLFPFGVATLLFVWAIWKRSRSPRSKFQTAFNKRKWQDVVTLGKQYQSDFKEESAIRHGLVIAYWKSEEQKKAMTDIQQLRADFPEFNSFIFTHALMFIERNEFETALKLLDEARDELEGDPSANAIAARCYRLLGQNEMMEEQADVIEKIACDSAAGLAFRCAVAIDRDDADLAESLWAKADLFAPNDAYIYLLKAEIEFRFGSSDEGQQFLVTAKNLADASPFAFIKAEVRYVEALADDDAGAQK